MAEHSLTECRHNQICEIKQLGTFPEIYPKGYFNAKVGRDVGRGRKVESKLSCALVGLVKFYSTSSKEGSLSFNVSCVSGTGSLGA